MERVIDYLTTTSSFVGIISDESAEFSPCKDIKPDLSLEV